MSLAQPRTQALIGLSLAAVMAATRFHHFGDTLHLPDASWALFFLAGFYLSPAWLLGLMAEAVAIDAAAVGLMGVSAYCLTPAYAALQLAHLGLWTGGRLSRRMNGEGSGLVALASVAAVTIIGAFLVSNGAFYWFGGRVADTNWLQFAHTFVDYGPAFLASTLSYLAVAALAHGLAVHLTGSRPTRLGDAT
ncbi:MAG: hypothetical protein AB1899_08195 [Pseudomonadota bacterium]